MANDIKWLKLMNNMFEDDKIEYIESLPDGDTILIIWVKILCLASKCNEGGELMITDELPYTTSLLANKFKKSSVQVEYALSIMTKLGMLEVIDNIIRVSNWAKYQNIDELAKIREQTRKRVAHYRERQKQLECNATSNVTETLNCNDFALNSISNIYNLNSNILDINNNTKDNNINNKNKKNNRVICPTLEQVKEYASQRGRLDLAESFFDYYSTGDWKDSKGNKVKNWKQKFITWEQHNQKPKQTTTSQRECRIDEDGVFHI